MLISKEVDVCLTQGNIGHYRKKGYADKMPTYKDDHYRRKVKVGTIIKVNVNDLPRYSEIEILFKCDYCGNDFTKTAHNYFNTLEKNLSVKKDCCDECKYIKLQECNQENFGGKSPFSSKEIHNKALASIYRIYGVNNVFQDENIKKQIVEDNLKKYGVKSSMQRKEVREKVIQTNIEKYGFVSPMQNKTISSKARNTLYKNSTAPCSQQQEYIYNLIGGELNYPVANYSLDIVFPEDKIYFECDFGGHWLAIKFGTLSENEFKNNERARWYFLYRKGWKEIRIISKQDYIPHDNILLAMLDYAKQYLNSGHHYIKFDIDNGKVINSQGEFVYDFGELRKIKLKQII